MKKEESFDLFWFCTIEMSNRFISDTVQLKRAAVKCLCFFYIFVCVRELVEVFSVPSVSF